jgi:hypothetical protein
MIRIRQMTAAALLIAAALVPASTASAGSLTDWLWPDDGPDPAYSPGRYWAPALGRVHDKHSGPYLSVYAPDRHPEISPECTILTFPCQPVDNAATIIPVPTPPATSKFKY